MMTLPNINRRGWLAAWAQQRRRRRHPGLLPAPVLRAQYPTQIVWDWSLANPYRWLVYTSLNEGATWFFTDDYWKWGADRMFAPDGGSELYYIVGVDADGNEVTGRSNAVRPDDAPMPSLLLSDLMAYWSLDETSGDFQDASGNGNTAYDDGPTPITRGAAGKISSGASCEDFGQCLRAPISDVAGNFSISFWLKSSTTNYYTAMSQSDIGYIGWLLTVAPAEPTFGISFQIYTGWPDGAGNEGAYCVTAPEVIDGEWHHIVCVKDGFDSFIYKDGELADANSSAFAMWTAESLLMLFDNSTALGQTLVGTLDEVGIWQRALSAAEASQLYNNGNGLAFEAF